MIRSTTTTPGRFSVDLVRELEQLPAEPTAAMRVLWMADDPDSSAESLASVVAADPGLTARIMRIANSAYYGLSGRVRSAAFAVTVLGFATVRSLAAAMAAGALEEGVTLPEGFWQHSATVATAASALAPRVGASPSEAFSLGLLHDLGRFILHRADTEGYTVLSAAFPHEADGLLDAERVAYGIDHAEAAGRVLRAWHFPDDLVAALAHHHDDAAAITSALGRAVVAGEALAAIAIPDGAFDTAATTEVTLSEAEAGALALARVEPDAVPALAAQVRRGGELLAASLRTA